jgi:uncharacterized integral membrane protein (TIGR00698 family)
MAGAMRLLPGLTLALTIAIISTMASSLHKSFDSLVISIIIGMLVANMLDERKTLEEGLGAAVKVFLPLGIGLYGAQFRLVGLETRLWPGVAIVFVLIFAVSYFISRGFGNDRTLSMLISTGMSVCGAAAIVIVAPLINAKKEDTSISILSVMTVGLTGMLFYRFLPDLMGLSVESYAFLTGMTLPMFGQVKVAAASMGPESLEMASNFKLIRVSALILITFLAMFIPGRDGNKSYTPWFMAVFFMLALASNISETVASARGILEPISKFSLTMALAAIGLNLNFESITGRGMGPLFACFLSWGIVVLSVYLLLSLVS